MEKQINKDILKSFNSKQCSLKVIENKLLEIEEINMFLNMVSKLGDNSSKNYRSKYDELLLKSKITTTVSKMFFWGCENETMYHDEREFVIPKALHHKIYDICELHKKELEREVNILLKSEEL